MTRKLRVKLIGKSADDLIRNQDGGKVHSIFDRTFNLLIGNKLVSIVREDVAPSPSTVIVDIPSSEIMSSLDMSNEMPVRIDGRRVLVDGVLEISGEGAKIWTPKTRLENYIDIKTASRNLKLAEGHALAVAGDEGLEQLTSYIDEISLGKAPPSSNLNRVAKLVLPRLTNTVASARNHDLRSIKKGARKLVGLGPGLTPSADDVLTGFMVARWWLASSLDGNLHQVESINSAITESVGRTTLVSRQQLIHGAKGETNEATEELIETILTGPAPKLKEGVERVSEIGETSGIDTMVGLFIGLKVSLDELG